MFFLAALATLHVLRPEIDPLEWGMSFHAVGSFSVLMTAAFIALGVSQLTLIAGFMRN